MQQKKNNNRGWQLPWIEAWNERGFHNELTNIISEPKHFRRNFGSWKIDIFQMNVLNKEIEYANNHIKHETFMEIEIFVF